MAIAATVYNPAVSSGSGSSGYSPDAIVVPSGGATSLTWSGLDGNTHKRYRIRGHGSNVGAGANITVNVNGGGTACTYSTFYQLNAAAPALGNTFAMTEFAGSNLVFVADLFVATGKFRVFQFQSWTINDAASDIIHCYTAVRWPDRTTNITSIALVASVANSFAEGYYAKLEEVV